ncbi:hypothetical protein BDV98DRAFT_577275 [Pterulicium gracile]|uniref:Uncharacterized protein n=1 Tax=Pterulicium gracile TaxID=1884261 RepID=A0A5C3Q412_9AGAR|nr:hypothetical protein BDV98DRAFT_577275 [Pterula gracilis]
MRRERQSSVSSNNFSILASPQPTPLSPTGSVHFIASVYQPPGSFLIWMIYFILMQTLHDSNCEP